MQHHTCKLEFDVLRGTLPFSEFQTFSFLPISLFFSPQIRMHSNGPLTKLVYILATKDLPMNGTQRDLVLLRSSRAAGGHQAAQALCHTMANPKALLSSASNDASSKDSQASKPPQGAHAFFLEQKHGNEGRPYRRAAVEDLRLT